MLTIENALAAPHGAPSAPRAALERMIEAGAALAEAMQDLLDAAVNMDDADEEKIGQAQRLVDDWDAAVSAITTPHV